MVLKKRAYHSMFRDTNQRTEEILEKHSTTSMSRTSLHHILMKILKNSLNNMDIYSPSKLLRMTRELLPSYAMETKITKTEKLDPRLP